MGKATLSYLKEVVGVNLNEDVVCFSSKDKQIHLSEGHTVESKALSSIAKFSGDIEGVFHFAFLTRDHASIMGNQKYFSANQEILMQLENFLTRNHFPWIVSVSSGAVFDVGTNILSTDPEQNPYGYLKLQEENLIKKLSNKNGATSIIGRLWGCSGYEMPIAPKYAFSDFIVQALTIGTIHITSPGEVWRRYIDERDFISVLYNLALGGETITLDSGGDLVEIGQLAELVSRETGAKISREVSQNQQGSNNYYPSGLVMREKAIEYGIKLCSIEEQVTRTILGHKSKLPQFLKENSVE